MPEMEFAGIGAAHVDVLWPLVERHIKRALEFGNGEYAPEDIKAFLKNRDMQLWVVGSGKGVAGAGVTQIVVYPRRKYLDMVLFAADVPFEECRPLVAAVERWAEKLCATPRIFGRKGWARKLPNYIPKFTVFVRSS